MFTEGLISGAIAVTMPIFAGKTFDVVLKKDDKMTNDVAYDSKIYEENARRRFVYNVTIGIIGLILAAYIKTPSTKWGVGLGSLIILVNGLYSYWGNMSEMHKWLVSAIALIACVMISIKLYDVGSISEILNNPFGKINM